MEMRVIYKETESILKIVVASIKTSLKKLEIPGKRESKIKNIKSKINEQ
jgi:hypothetical protein